MDKKIRWGIIGLGKIAHKFAGDLKLSENSELYGVASRNLKKAEQFAKSYHAKKAYGTYEDLATDPNIDIVYIATPHVFHFPNTMLCLEHEKHVLCEKPMGMNGDQVQKMIAKAQEKKRFLMEGLWTRFIPATNKLLDLLGQHAIGDIILIEADFGFKPPVDPDKRIYNKSLGGGSLLDIGIYPIYLSLLILGTPDKIRATATYANTGVDTYCAMLLDYANGAKAVLQSTFLAQTTTEATIYGTHGSIKLHTPFHHSQQITITLEGQEDELFNIPIVGEGYSYEIQEVEECLRNEKLQSDRHSHSFSIRLTEMLDRVSGQIDLKYDDQ